MYERFTDRARKTMQLANQEAQRFNHEYIGTEHILLGLVKLGEGVAAMTLKRLDVDLRKVRIEVDKLVQSGPDMVTIGKLPQTPRANKTIQYAMEEARNLHHNYVGTEHLLLGLLREQEGVAAQVLMNLRLKLEDVREAVLVLLAHSARGISEAPWLDPMPDAEAVTALKKLTGRSGGTTQSLYDWFVELIRGLQWTASVMNQEKLLIFTASIGTASAEPPAPEPPELPAEHFVSWLKGRIGSPGMPNRQFLECMTLLVMKGQDIAITMKLMSGIMLTLHDPKTGNAPETPADDDEQDTLDGTPSHP